MANLGPIAEGPVLNQLDQIAVILSARLSGLSAAGTNDSIAEVCRVAYRQPDALRYPPQ